MVFGWPVRYVQEWIWAVDQEILKQEDGSIILKMKTSGWYEVKRWVLGYGPEAEVLQLLELRTKISRSLKEARDVYN